jgi:hypothetical protein
MIKFFSDFFFVFNTCYFLCIFNLFFAVYNQDWFGGVVAGMLFIVWLQETDNKTN